MTKNFKFLIVIFLILGMVLTGCSKKANDNKDLNYHNLEDVHNGSEAMNTYRDLINKTKEEQEII